MLKQPIPANPHKDRKGLSRIGPEWHSLSKRAKDMGSAAVLLSLLLCALTWCLANFQRLAT